jgi:uncharacterized protein (TIGR03067 family)
MILLAVVVALTGCGKEDSPPARAKEKEGIQGTWTAIALIDNGREESKDDVKRLKLTIQGDKYVYAYAGVERTFAAAYKIDPTKNPKEMDVTFEEGPEKGNTMLAIYSLEGDELRIC